MAELDQRAVNIQRNKSPNQQKQDALNKDPKFDGGRKDLVVMIKPTAATNYQNIIRSLDDMTINDVRKFALEEIGDDEKKLLREMKIDQ
jgi:hypothetical protein